MRDPSWFSFIAVLEYNTCSPASHSDPPHSLATSDCNTINDTGG